MQPERNILVITTDQQRFDTIQAAGNDRIWTPHLNWLCDNGIRFTRAYSDSPVCLPARVTLMNGRHAAHHGVRSNRFVAGALDPATSLPGLLTRGGYQTRLLGKAHFAPHIRNHGGFEHLELDADYHRFHQRYPQFGRPRENGLGGNEHVPGIDTIDEVHTLSHHWVDRTIDFIETRDPDRPFFAWLSFNDPHPPLVPHRSYWELYRDRPVAAPWSGDWSQDQAALPAAWQSVTWELSMTQRLAGDQLADVRRAYYALITQVDYHLGRLFARLRELKLLENTLIIFTTDHGEMLGDHHLGGKCVPFEGAAHIPFIVKPPAAPRDHRQPWRGTTCDALVCLADILPTCLAYAGLPATTAPCDGFDLLAVAQGVGRRERLFLDCMHLHGVVEGRFKLCRETLSGHELLFDLDADPREQHDLLRAGVAPGGLRAVLDAHLDATGQRQAGSADPAVPRSAVDLPRNVHPGFATRIGD